MSTAAPHLLDFEPRHLEAILDRFSGLRILVVGDIIADEYLYGRTSRVSREAPVLILRKVARTFAPGGGANTANNLAALGAKVTYVGALGEDLPGQEMRTILTARGISLEGVITCPDLPTTTKTRVLAGGHQTSYQQVVRIDDETPLPPGSRYEEQLVQQVESLLPSHDGCIVSDYSLGVVSMRMVATVNRLRRKAGTVLTVDSREKLLSFQGVTAVTPNEAEVEHVMSGSIGDDEAALHRLGGALRSAISAEQVLVTRGNRGMCLFREGLPPVAVPIYGPDQVADVTGAGDTVIATYTLALAAGADAVQAMVLANIAGGLSVMKVGTATVPLEELREHVKGDRR